MGDAFEVIRQAGDGEGVSKYGDQAHGIERVNVVGEGDRAKIYGLGRVATDPAR